MSLAAGDSTCKGPEVGMCLPCVHGSQYEYGEHWVSSRRVSQRGKKARLCKTSQATARTPAFAVSEKASHWKASGRVCHDLTSF